MIVALLLVMLVAPASAGAGSVVEGRVNTVRDADTIVVSGTPVRFNGVDAPEINTRAGQDARRWMVGAVRGHTVRCELTGEKTYDRWVGTCFIGQNESVGCGDCGWTRPRLLSLFGRTL